MRKKITSILLALAGFSPANAQYTFTISVSWSGNCGGYTAQMNQAIRGFQTQAINGFPTRELCEQARAMCHQELGHIELVYYDVKTGKEIKREATNCKLNVSTSPCTGRPMAGSIGTLNALGVSQGTSFYSTNTANEIQNWNEDDMERMLALDTNRVVEQELYAPIADSKYKSAIIEENGKMYFRSLNVGEDGQINTRSSDLIMPKVIPANEEMVSMYLNNINRDSAPLAVNTEKYITWIKEQFKLVSGYDIDEIIKTIGRTNQQSEVLRDYREFEKRLLDDAKKQLDNYLNPIEHSKEKKEIDMAILALDSYGKDDKGYLFQTNYKRVELDKVALNDPMRELANKLTSCNQTNYETGFNAVLYYNSKTNEYTVAFEGSAFPSFGKSSEITTASKIAPSFDFDMNSKEYVVNALGLEMRIPQDMWNDWGKNNALQAAGRIASQFQMAKEIADILNASPELKNLNINFTGHSLGGALASVAGLSTGKPTFTYNSEGVSDKILENFGLLDKKNNRDYNITAYHTDNDILTNTQKWAQGEGKKPMTDVIAEETGKLSIDNALSQLKQLGYDTKTAKTLTGVIFDGTGADFNVFAKAIDSNNERNDLVPTAIGDEKNVGDFNSSTDKLIAGAVGVVAGGIHLYISKGKDLDTTYGIVKKAAELTDGALAHRMEPFVKNMMLRNVVEQNLWDRFNKEKQSMDREISNTEMRSLEQIYIVTD